MFAFVGGSKRPKKTLEGAVKILADGHDGETAIYDTETGKLYSLSGEPTVILTPAEYTTVKMILGMCALASSAAIPFPSKTVSAMISSLSPALAKDAVLTAAEIYKTLRKQHGGSEPTRSDESG
jgi:hypothetical protein